MFQQRARHLITPVACEMQSVQSSEGAADDEAAGRRLVLLPDLLDAPEREGLCCCTVLGAMLKSITIQYLTSASSSFTQRDLARSRAQLL